MRSYLILVLALVTTVVWAANPDKKSGAALTPGATLEATGSCFSRYPIATPQTFYVESSYALVKFSCPTGHAQNLGLLGSATVSLTVDYKVENKLTGALAPRTDTKVLKIDFAADLATDISFAQYSDAHQIKVTISAISVPAGWPLVELEASIVTKFYDVLTSSITASKLRHQTTLTSNGNLKIQWDAMSSAQYYELEWTYVSNQSPDRNLELAFDEIEVPRDLFRNNSSRVSVYQTSYEIPMIYEAGVILYRLRAVGKRIFDGKLVNACSDWTVQNGTFSTVQEFVNKSKRNDFTSGNCFKTSGLEQKLNWTSELIFGQEGKNVVKVKYHDGSQRERQNILRSNTDQRSIVSETFYDYAGRPVISTLPAPVTDAKITYIPNFNLKVPNTALLKSDYATTDNVCSPPVLQFSKETGAAEYYSDSNPFVAGGNTEGQMINRELLPDAEGYPYVQTRYLSDNTNRVMSKSGLGANHRIGSGHEEKFYYGTPMQSELSRLFGSQVGYAGKYKKNISVDANKISTVSYLDGDGKIIATALAGDTIGSNQFRIPGNVGRTISNDVLKDDPEANLLSPDRKSKSFTTEFTVSGPDLQHRFLYNASVGKYDVKCANGNTAAVLDGAVDVNMQVVDPCGKVVFEQNKSTNKGHTGNTQTLVIDEARVLSEGTYQVSKTLKINEKKLEEYWQEYLKQTGTCLKTELQLENAEVAAISFVGCGMTCTDCRTELDRLIAARELTSTEDIARVTKMCDDLCNYTTGCQSSLVVMIGDVSPGGQYGQLRKEQTSFSGTPGTDLDPTDLPDDIELDVDLNSVNTDEDGFDKGSTDDQVISTKEFPLSVFNKKNALRVRRDLASLFSDKEKLRASWKTPVKIHHQGFTGENWKNQVLFNTSLDFTMGVSYSETDYTDEFGAVYYVPVKEIRENGEVTYEPAVDDPANIINEGGRLKVKAKHLKRTKDFAKLWKAHWANYLVIYHPEFEYFQTCTKNYPSHKFDLELINTATAAEAKAKGFLDANFRPIIIGESQNVSKDPYLKSNAPVYQKVKDTATVYASVNVFGQPDNRSMAQVATISIGCPRGLSGCGNASCTDGILNTDAEWNAYKGIYLGMKQFMMKGLDQIEAVNKYYYNGCIGHEDILTLPEAEYFRAGVEVCNEQIAYDVWNCSTVVVTESTYQECAWERVISCLNSETYFPYANPAQLCYEENIELYKKKAARFYPIVSSKEVGSQTAHHCFVYVPNQDITKPGYKIPKPCADDIKTAADNISYQAYRDRYWSCGQCPVAQDIERVLIDLETGNYLTSTTPVLLSCESDPVAVHLGEQLRSMLLNGTIADISWSAVLSNGDRTLTGTLRAGNVNNTVTLTIPAGAPALVNFRNLRNFCCLEVDQSVTGPLAGKKFILHGKFNSSFIQIEEVQIQGEISFALNSCDFPPRCITTTDADRVTVFLNSLCSKTPLLPSKPHDLVSATDVNLMDNNRKPVYNTMVRMLLKKDNLNVENGYVDDMSSYQPKWRSSLSGNKLNGVFSYRVNNAAAQLVIEITPTSVLDFSKVKDFSNLRPAPFDAANPIGDCQTGDCQRTFYLADALIVSGGNRSYHTVKISVPAYVPVVCKPVRKIQN